MKVSRAGYDVNTCADNELLYSSSFPTLSIIQTGVINSGATINHSWGYFPAYTTVDFSSIGFDNGTESAFADQHGNLSISSTQIKNLSGEAKRYYLFNREIRTNYTAQNIKTTATTEGTKPQDYGFKVSKDGENVRTGGLEELVSFSGLNVSGNSVRQIIIHQSGYSDNLSSGSSTNFSHNLGYVPMFMAWYRQNGVTFYELAQNVITSGFTGLDFEVLSNSSNLVVNNNFGYAIDFAYIIFKDPF